MAFDLLAALAAGYLLGGIPTAEWLARTRGASIFSVGSGNMGAMNTARNLGPGLGLAVASIDVGKGALATLVGLWLGGASGAAPLAGVVLASAAGVGAVVGHAWSPYVRFRGGKALATMFGVSLPLYPLGGAYGVLLLVALVLLLRRTTLASVITLTLYPFLVFLTLAQQQVPQAVALAVFTGVVPLAVVSIAKHLLALRRVPDASDRAGSERG